MRVLKIQLVVLIVGVIEQVIAVTNPSEDVLRDLHSKFAKYNKDLRPNIGGQPVLVNISLYVLAVQDVSDKNMDFTLDAYFRQFWNDPRLAFEGNDKVDKIVFGVEKINEIWKPDTFFVNKKTSGFKDPERDSNSFLRIEQTGDILISRRITVTAACPMDLSQYPMDSQLCSLELESFGHSMSDIHYNWQDGDESVKISPDVSLPNFDVLGCRQRLIEASLPTGNYSRLMVDFQFSRASGHFKLLYFFPAGVLVVFSWLSFLVDNKKTMPRLTIGMAPLFSIIFLEIQAVQQTSPISYLKALDIYLVFCGFLVFVSILLTVLPNFLMMIKDLKDDTEDPGEGHVMAKGGGFRLFQINCFCLVIFPVIFLVFNLAFWNIYTGSELVDGLINIEA